MKRLKSDIWTHIDELDVRRSSSGTTGSRRSKGDVLTDIEDMSVGERESNYYSFLSPFSLFSAVPSLSALAVANTTKLSSTATYLSHVV